MQLRNVNLNLLPVLHALLVHRNVTHAAEDVGMTQSAASKALACLRATLHDPLLIRRGSHYVLSSRAEELLPKVADACSAAEAVFRTVTFDPATCERTFRLAMPDYGAIMIAPAIRETLENEAPGVTLRFIDSALDEALFDVNSDFLMLAHEWLEHPENADYQRFLLLEEEMVYVKPRNREPTSQVVFAYKTPKNISRISPRKQPEELQYLPVRTRVEQGSLLPLLSSLLDATSLAPRSIVELLMPVLPVEIDHNRKPDQTHLSLYLCWHPRFNEDPEHRWLRETLRRLFAPSRSMQASLNS
jgi:DNA-binding transcriptional LysR family regulator